MIHVCRPLELGRMIGYCGHLGKLYTEQRLRSEGYDVTPVQSHALAYLAHATREQEINQRDLERELRLRPSTVNGIVDRLEEKGYIARHQSATDGRCRLVSLTGRGAAMVQAFQCALQGTERQFCSALTEEEQSQMREFLSRIIASLENEVNHI